MISCVVLIFNRTCLEMDFSWKNLLRCFMLLHTCVCEKTWNLKSGSNLNGVVEKGYYVEVLIGTPPQPLNILIDTGSSNFAVASEENPLVTKYFHASNSTTVKRTNLDDVDIRYTEGFWTGRLVSDMVSIPAANFSDAVRVSFVEIEDSENFFINNSGWQGILGMAYDDIIRPQDSTFKSFASLVLGNSRMDDIFSLKLCMADVFQFHSDVSGKFILGGYNRSLSQVYWTPIVKEWYYDVSVLGLEVGHSPVSIACSEFNNDRSIVDSGTTNLRLPTVIFNQVVAKVTNYVLAKAPSLKISGKFWEGIDDLCWKTSESPYFVFPNITIYLPSVEFNHTISLYMYPEHYILYRGLTEQASKAMACYKFGISSSETGTVLGAVFMEQYDVIFDRANKRVGFATSDCSPTSVLHYTEGYVNSTSCSYSASKKFSTLQIVSYILLGLLSLCMIPVCILGCAWLTKQRKKPALDYTNLLRTPSYSE